MEDDKYLFLIVDKEKAKMFLFQQKNIENYTEITNAIVDQKIKANKGSLYARNSKLMRRIENQLKQHLRFISQNVRISIKGQRIKGVFIGGHQQLFHEIEASLPMTLQRKVVGEFVTELNIPKNKLINNAEKAWEVYKKSEEVK